MTWSDAPAAESAETVHHRDAEHGVVGPVEVGSVAHGGHCVARHDGRVIFVRHALPGERVLVRLTDTGHDRFWRGDAIEVLHADPDRVAPSCPAAGPGLCGGCDFQHVALPRQRELKAAVVAEQLQRLAGLDVAVTVEEVRHPAVHAGRGWRTRMTWHATDDGRLGMRRHRSHDLVPVDDHCELRAATVPLPDPAGIPAGTAIRSLAAELSPPVIMVDRPVAGASSRATDAAEGSGAPVVRERAAGHLFDVRADGFWQVHPAAADALTEAVRSMLDPHEGERAFDLYCGVGLFAAMLADHGVRVWGVEASRAAIGLARGNVASARFTVGRVERVLDRLPSRTDLVVLDPPRSGAGRRVMTAVLCRRPRAIAYVACDPAALARDIRTALDEGWELAALRAFDLFPMTHHVECVALLTKSDSALH